MLPARRIVVRFSLNGMTLRLPAMTLLMSMSCVITNPTEFVQERPLTPPRIRDEQGVTRPRLGNLIELRETDTGVEFLVPVDDAYVGDVLQWQFFVNVDRDCRPTGGTGCEAQADGELSPDGNVRRYVELSLPEHRFAVGCNRVELWVSSSFRRTGDRHTPTRVGDVDSTTWWVFKRARAGAGDAGTLDPVESCANRVSP